MADDIEKVLPSELHTFPSAEVTDLVIMFRPGAGDGLMGTIPFGDLPEGPQGDPGLNGWSPIFALVSDGERRVLQLVAWTGGTGATPTAYVGQYVGPAGMTVSIASGVDLRGATGATGAPGTMNGPASSVDSEVALFSGTSGALLKRATGTGIPKLTAGVQGIATAGTDYVAPNTTSSLVAGYSAISFSAGTKSSGTFTPDPANGNFQHYTNGGAHTLAPPTAACTIILECTNASAGAITMSGFNVISGDTYSTTGTKKHIFRITRTQSFSSIDIQYVTGT